MRRTSAGSHLQRADQLLSPAHDRLVADHRRYSADNGMWAMTALNGFQELVVQARDDALVTYTDSPQ
ncbi:hypothetical protein [Streptomyces olivoreticuli]|uniref:hypothetical protein n=1 Tax=Streptomyces olivoreticuli TaxID=68246 RepID=UPI000E231B1E|nr:hypothetical protein [Streptomyces olivoreticuli]